MKLAGAGNPHMDQWDKDNSDNGDVQFYKANCCEGFLDNVLCNKTHFFTFSQYWKMQP